MSHVLEVDAQKGLHIPLELLGGVNAHTRYIVEIQAERVILQPEKYRAEKPKPFWETATPEERAQAFIEWASSHKSGQRPPAPALSLEAMSRESIYD